MCDHEAKLNEMGTECMKAAAAKNGLSEEATTKVAEYFAAKYKELKEAGKSAKDKTPEEIKAFLDKCVAELKEQISEAKDQDLLETVITEAYEAIKEKKKELGCC